MDSVIHGSCYCSRVAINQRWLMLWLVAKYFGVRLW